MEVPDLSLVRIKTAWPVMGGYIKLTTLGMLQE